MFTDYDSQFMGMDNGPGGGMVTGKWTNKRTGEQVMVRDSIMDGDGMSILLYDGSTLTMEEFSRDYIQISDEEYDMNGNVSNSAPSPGAAGVSGRVIELNKQSTPPMNNPMPIVDDYYEAEEMVPTKSTPIKASKPTQPLSTNYDLIDKVFKSTQPNIIPELNLVCNDFPTNELVMLTNIFGVTLEEISQYIFEQYFNEEEMYKHISDYLWNLLGIEPKVVEEDKSTLEVDEK